MIRAAKKQTEILSSQFSGRTLPSDSAFPQTMIHRKSSCACGGGCPTCVASSNDLKISQPNDPAEIEADAIADRVMRMSTQDAKPQSHLSKTPNENLPKFNVHGIEKDEADQEPVMRKEASSSTAQTPPPDTPPSIKSVINSGGQPLDPQTRSFFEPRFGYDLSSVRIHPDSSAGQTAMAIDARAYTLGNNIVFGNGEYRPESESGKRLIAHELVHLVQSKENLINRQTIYRQPDSGKGNQARKGGSANALKPFVQSDLVREIKRDNDNWMLTIDGFTEPDSVKRMIWPRSLPTGITVELQVAITDPIERGWFVLRGITSDNVKSMESSIAKLFSDHWMDGVPLSTPTIDDPRKSPRYIDNLFESVSYNYFFGVTTFYWTENGAKKNTKIPLIDLMQDESKTLTPNFRVFPNRDAARGDVYQYNLAGLNDLYTFYTTDGNVIMPTLFSRQSTPQFHALWPGLREDIAKDAKEAQKAWAEFGNVVNPIPGTELDEEGNLSISTNPLSWLPLVFHIAPHVKFRGGTPDVPTIKTDPGHGSKPPDVAPPPARPAPPKPVDTPAAPKPVDTPAAPKPVDTPAAPKPVDTPAAPKPVDTPAPGKPVDTPTPAKPVDTPAPKPADQPTATPPKVADEPAVPAKSKQAMEQAKAINEGKIAELDQKILKHETKKKDLFDKATRIENERKTPNFRDEAAKAKRQAVNEARLADEARAERNRLAAENKKISDEINPPPKPKIGPGPNQPHGGAYKDIPTAGGEVNHIPADSVTKIPYEKGPSIWMEKADHLETNSWGNRNFKPTKKYPYSSSSEWRAAQKELIKKGRIQEAVQMDIDDIRSKFGSKYDKGIEQMLEYIKTLKPGEF